MTKHLGNRIGYAVTAVYDEGGVYDLFSQFHFIKQNKWQGNYANGGNEITTPGNGYRYHFFTSPGTLSVTSPTINLEYIVVAGGGGGGLGGFYTSGGGGAGGYRSGTILGLPLGEYPVVIGSGGALNTSGNPSTFYNVESQGGGRGGSGPSTPIGSPGGSGGGGGDNSPAPPNGGLGSRVTGTATPAPSQGSPGGQGSPPSQPTASGGGGGAGGGGGNYSPPNFGGAGGIGTRAFSGDLGVPTDYGTPGPTAGRWFGGGGGGGGYPPPTSRSGTGGAGGGGNAGSPTKTPAQAGTQYTGGGGGGSSIPGPTSGAAGGSGIVIVRYLIQ